jgi:hypothetical protein
MELQPGPRKAKILPANHPWRLGIYKEEMFEMSFVASLLSS